jgi:hypothetical protein
VISYSSFFSGTATVAGSLVGLLFVALSVSPQRLRHDAAFLEHQAVAASAFTALVDALFISLIGLEPGGGLRWGALSLGLVGLSSSASLASRLYRARDRAQLSQRWSHLLGLITLIYVAQVVCGLLPLSNSAEASMSVAFVYAMFATGIGRSWSLLGLDGGGLLDFLTHRSDLPKQPPPRAE